MVVKRPTHNIVSFSSSQFLISVIFHENSFIKYLRQVIIFQFNLTVIEWGWTLTLGSIVNILATRCDNVIECLNGKDEKGCGLSEYITILIGIFPSFSTSLLIIYGTNFVFPFKGSVYIVRPYIYSFQFYTLSNKTDLK